MKIKDTVVVAFLVSVGVFSAGQASRYVGTLSAKEKQSLFVMAQNSATMDLSVVPTGPDCIGTNCSNNNK